MKLEEVELYLCIKLLAVFESSEPYGVHFSHHLLNFAMLHYLDLALCLMEVKYFLFGLILPGLFLLTFSFKQVQLLLQVN